MEKEGKDVNGLYKVNLDKAMVVIQRIIKNLENNKKFPMEMLQEAIANAEINIAHDLLTTNDIYVLEEPDQVKASKTTKHLNRTLSNLKRENPKMTDEANRHGGTLLKEGKELEKEFQNWEQKAKAGAYNKKSNEYFKKYNPNYYEEDWLWYN